MNLKEASGEMSSAYDMFCVGHETLFSLLYYGHRRFFKMGPNSSNPRVGFGDQGSRSATHIILAEQGLAVHLAKRQSYSIVHLFNYYYYSQSFWFFSRYFSNDVHIFRNPSNNKLDPDSMPSRRSSTLDIAPFELLL